MMRIDVDASAAIGDLRAAPDQIARAIQAALRRTGVEGQGVMKRVIASKVSKGGFSQGARGGMAGSVSVELSGASVTIGPQVSYAKYTNKPTRPHIIEAKNAEALTLPIGWAQFRGAVRFQPKTQGPGTHKVSQVRMGGKIRKVVAQGGRTADFFVRVRHPGTRGLRWLEATHAELEPAAQDIFADEIQRQLRAVKK